MSENKPKALCLADALESLREPGKLHYINRAAKELRRLHDVNADLLETLQHIQRCIPMGGFAQIHHNSDTWVQIDAAIAKATGETKSLIE